MCYNSKMPAKYADIDTLRNGDNVVIFSIIVALLVAILTAIVVNVHMIARRRYSFMTEIASRRVVWGVLGLAIADLTMFYFGLVRPIVGGTNILPYALTVAIIVSALHTGLLVDFWKRDAVLQKRYRGK